MKVCVNCGIAGPNISCVSHTMWTGYEAECEMSSSMDIIALLFKEIGRLNVELHEKNKVIKDITTSVNQGQRTDLRSSGKELPLKGHEESCPHGKTGWALCTCENRQEERTMDPSQYLENSMQKRLNSRISVLEEQVEHAKEFLEDFRCDIEYASETVTFQKHNLLEWIDSCLNSLDVSSHDSDKL